jgi:hypothetical protein
VIVEHTQRIIEDPEPASSAPNAAPAASPA